jgi:hypothetical protein
VILPHTTHGPLACGWCFASVDRSKDHPRAIGGILAPAILPPSLRAAAKCFTSTLWAALRPPLRPRAPERYSFPCPFSEVHFFMRKKLPDRPVGALAVFTSGCIGQSERWWRAFTIVSPTCDARFILCL